MQQFAGCVWVATIDSCLSSRKSSNVLDSKWNSRTWWKRSWHQRAGDRRDQIGDSFAVQRTYNVRPAGVRPRIGESLDQLRTLGRCDQVDLVDDVNGSHVWCKLWQLEFGFVN